MTSMDLFLNYIHRLPDGLIYFFLGLSAFVENLFPPIPGDTITAFGAFLVGTGRLSLVGVYLSTTFGSLMGFLSLFWLGGYLGRRFFIRRDFRFLKKENIIKAEEWFKRYGYFMILLNRFFPGIRSAIAVAGGISGLKRQKVIFLALISCSAWNLLWISLGLVLGNNWDMVVEKISGIFAQYNLAILVLFMIFILFIIIRKAFRR